MENDIHVVPNEGARGAPGPGTEAEPSIGELFRQLAQDSATLVRQEISLARAEMRENLRGMVGGVVLLAIGGGALLMAALALTAFVIALLGIWLGHNYWLSALIVGVVYALIGAMMLARGKKVMQTSELKPERTIQTLNDDKRWAQAEARQVRRDLSV
jgi:uncharacterized membrane protein YqjE